jgi:hypothetical protein
MSRFKNSNGDIADLSRSVRSENRHPYEQTFGGDAGRSTVGAQFDIVHSYVQQMIRPLRYWDIFLFGSRTAHGQKKGARVDVFSYLLQQYIARSDDIVLPVFSH